MKGKYNKKGRIIIRNLSYKVDEESLNEFFKSYGAIKEVALLKHDDGRNKGVAFLQYSNGISAMKAIKECNMKPLLGRPIAVDLAVPINRFAINEPKENGAPPDDEEPMLTPKSEVKEEPPENMDETEYIDKERLYKEELTSNDQSPSVDDEDSEDDDRDKDEDDHDDVDDHDEDEDEMESENTFKHKPVSNDVAEGKSLFLRNLSLQATEQEVADALSQFGKLKYVLFCKDKITGRLKGTGFAQYLSKESADTCVESTEDPLCKDKFIINGRRLMISRALGREEINIKISERDAKREEVDSDGKKIKKQKEVKDERNLFLAREGVVREGTKPAKGVSNIDLILRRQREVIKRRMLANFSIVVSPIRLFICNLPLELSDRELKNIFKQHTSSDSVITECRIMRNVYEIDDKGIPISKGHGFVSLSQHKHALEALRNINNNPTIFTNKMRPIVEFSLENKAALKAKENRMKRSKEKSAAAKGVSNSVAIMKPDSVSVVKPKEEVSFMGSNYDPQKRGKKALHSHIGPKIRHRNRDETKKGKITRNKINHQLQRGNKRRGKGKNREKKTKPGGGGGSKTNKNKTSKKSRNISSSKKGKSKSKKFIH